MAENTKILIGTPCYGNVVTVPFVDSLFNTLSHFGKHHPTVHFDYKFVNLTMITFARNLMASHLLNHKDYTHLLMIDADMGFAPSLIEKMLNLKKPVVSAIAPHRQFDYETFHEIAGRYEDHRIAKLVAQPYVGVPSGIYRDDNLKVSGEGKDAVYSVNIKDGAIRMREAGTGIILIERTVFEQLLEKYPDLYTENIEDTYAKWGLEGGVFQCFQPFQNERGIYLGEDIAFTKRWTEGCKGEIWAIADEVIIHFGTETFAGHYQTRATQYKT